jgi:uncharacterized protein
MGRIVLILIGCVASGLAVLGVLLPGLPTTPFLLVALWAFARSSPALYGYLHGIPLLRHGLQEAHRFEEKRAVHLNVKIGAVAIAWLSVFLTAFASDNSPVLVLSVGAAALAGSLFMWWIPTDRT